jgi:hypothetical protein
METVFLLSAKLGKGFLQCDPHPAVYSSTGLLGGCDIFPSTQTLHGKLNTETCHAANSEPTSDLHWSDLRKACDGLTCV